MNQINLADLEVFAAEAWKRFEDLKTTMDQHLVDLSRSVEGRNPIPAELPPVFEEGIDVVKLLCDAIEELRFVVADLVGFDELDGAEKRVILRLMNLGVDSSSQTDMGNVDPDIDVIREFLGLSPAASPVQVLNEMDVFSKRPNLDRAHQILRTEISPKFNALRFGYFSASARKGLEQKIRQLGDVTRSQPVSFAELQRKAKEDTDV